MAPTSGAPASPCFPTSAGTHSPPALSPEPAQAWPATDLVEESGENTHAPLGSAQLQQPPRKEHSCVPGTLRAHRPWAGWSGPLSQALGSDAPQREEEKRGAAPGPGASLSAC